MSLTMRAFGVLAVALLPSLAIAAPPPTRGATVRPAAPACEPVRLEVFAKAPSNPLQRKVVHLCGKRGDAMTVSDGSFQATVTPRSRPGAEPEYLLAFRQAQLSGEPLSAVGTATLALGQRRMVAVLSRADGGTLGVALTRYASLEAMATAGGPLSADPMDALAEPSDL